MYSQQLEGVLGLLHEFSGDLQGAEMAKSWTSKGNAKSDQPAFQKAMMITLGEVLWQSFNRLLIKI